MITKRRLISRAGSITAVALLASCLSVVSWSPANAAASICDASETITWDGSSSADWTDAANWDTNAIPINTDKVCVPADMPRDPVISGGANAFVDQIEVALGATLGIQASTLNIANDSSIATLTMSGSGVHLANEGDLTVDTALNMTQGLIDGAGSITTVIGANFSTSGVKNIDQNFTNEGILTWNDGNLDFESNEVSNTGQWRIPGTGDTLIAQTFTNGGTVSKTNAGTVVLDASIVNNNTLTISGSATATVPAARTFTTTGTVTVTGATLTHQTGTIAIDGGHTHVASAGTIESTAINVGGGALTGNGGSYVGSVTISSGTLMPGTNSPGSTGSFNINGTLTQTGGQYQVDMNGTTPATNYDTVAVSGVVDISGATIFVNSDGYSPAGGTDFDVMSYASVTGEYTSITDEFTGEPDGYFTADYGASPLTITAHFLGSISGYAFVDNNADGDRDGGENQGLSGVTIYLDNDNSGTFSGGDNSDVTDANGFWEIEGVTPGLKNVRNNNTPGGYARSTNLPLAATVPEGANVNAHIGFYENISISGRAFNDLNLNGIEDLGDTNAPGQTMFLDANNNGTLDGGEVNMLTDGSGNYTFNSLTPGTYWVRVVLPAGGILTTSLPPAMAVNSGTTATDVNFGLDAVTGTLSGNVFIDTNGDGVRDGGETTPMSGVTVFIDTNANGTLDGGERNTTTNGDGDYEFTQVQPGAVHLDVVTPGNYTQTTSEIAFNLATNTDVGNLDVGLFQAPSIGGLVYSDIDSDGSKQINEGGVSGVTVFLDTDDNGALDMGETSTTTNAAGVYIFENVPGGTYKVRIVAPSPGVQTSVDPGDIVVTSSTGAADINFGVDVSGSIEGQVFNDVNGNGVKDVGETTGIENVVVFLDLDGDGELDAGEQSVQTDSTGAYLFSPVPSQTYDVDIVIPAGTTQTSAELNGVVVGPNQAVSDQNVGLFTLTTISGLVYQDTDNDAVRDSGEPGLSGITVFIDSDNSGTRDGGEPTTTTANDGTFTFDGLDNAPQRVRIVTPAGAVRNSANPAAINLQSGTPVTDVTFALDVLGSLNGTVFVDTNGNGVKDGGEATPLTDITVYIDSNINGVLDDGEPTVVTDVHGNYTFDLLPAGTYDIDVVLPDGWVQTTSELGGTALTLNQDRGGLDIGAHQNGTITGFVFFDVNVNKTYDDEEGIKGVTVFIDDNGNDIFDSGEQFTTTANDGTYALIGVGPGPKTVRSTGWDFASLTTDDPAPITLNSGTTEANVNFGYDLGVVGSADPTNQGTGYWMLGADGQVFEFGTAQNYGSLDELTSPAAGIAPTPTGKGYWVATAGGGVNAFGDATFLGSAARLSLNQPIIGIEPTPTGKGYWLLGADGGVFSYGDAEFFGSTGSMILNAPVKAMASTGDGKGYWLVAEDGGVFAFGNAQFKGSMGGQSLNKPVVGITGTSTGDGYLLVASDGGIFNFGAPFFGSAANFTLDAPIVGIRSRGDGRGYWLIGQDGGLFAFGVVPFLGNAKAQTDAPIVN